MTIGLCSNSRQISSVIDSCASSEFGESKNGGFQTPNRNKTSLFKRPVDYQFLAPRKLL